MQRTSFFITIIRSYVAAVRAAQNFLWDFRRRDRPISNKVSALCFDPAQTLPLSFMTPFNIQEGHLSWPCSRYKNLAFGDCVCR
jgi:hypothetical protein